MGRYLRIYPDNQMCFTPNVAGGLKKCPVFVCTKLDIDQDSDLFERIDKLKKLSIPEFRSYVLADGMGETREDAYGVPLRLVSARQLVKAFADAKADHVMSWRNLAALGWLKACPPDTWIVIHWH